MASICKKCKTEENLRRLTIPIKTRKEKVLKTKKIWVCEPCISEYYTDYRSSHPRVMIRGTRVNIGPRD